MLTPMRILAIFAHPDDEIGCAATLAKHAQAGHAVTLVWTTMGELASQFGDTPAAEVQRIRREHGAWVAGKIGAEHAFFDMGDSRMTGGREEALQLARLYAHFRPEAVLTWSDDHPHPDHRMTAKVAFDALTLARIPKIVNEGAAPAPDTSDDGLPEGGEDIRRLEAHRKPVRFFQYHSAASPHPEVFVDVSDTAEIGAEVMAYYQAFYGWEWSKGDYLRGREQLGRMAGCRYAERYTLRRGHAPAYPLLP